MINDTSYDIGNTHIPPEEPFDDDDYNAASNPASNAAPSETSSDDNEEGVMHILPYERDAGSMSMDRPY